MKHFFSLERQEKHKYTHIIKGYYSAHHSELVPLDKSKEDTVYYEDYCNNISHDGDLIIYHSYNVWDAYVKVKIHKDNVIKISEANKNEQ